MPLNWNEIKDLALAWSRYDPLTMPTPLLAGHQKPDHAVDAAYGRTKFGNEAERVAYLFTLYEKLTTLLPTQTPPKTRRKPLGLKPGAGLSV